MSAGAKDDHLHIGSYRTNSRADLNPRQDKCAADEYNPFVSTARLEEVLRNFGQVATKIKTSNRRETWRFEFDGRGYFLYFYPRDATRARWARVSPAHAEFFGLQTLQKASIPSPRAVAQLSGFRLEERVGDAVIVESVEPARRLDELLLEAELNGRPLENRRRVALQVRTILHQLGRAGLGHDGLRLRSFLVGEGRVFLRDGAGLRSGGLRKRQVMLLAHDAARFVSASERRRTWDLLMPGTDMPRRNPLSRKLWRQFVRGVFGQNQHFGRLRDGAWAGVFSKRSKFARRYASASRLDVTHADWRDAWPALLRQIEHGDLLHLKQDASGDIMSATVMLAGQSVPIIIKRPRRRLWYRYLLDAGRAARARRTWRKTWQVIVRNLPTEWPMLLMEKRVLGYVVDAVIIFERVPGTTLDQLDLDALSVSDRQMLFRRAGGMLRRLEQSGLAHYDAKSTNWIVWTDPRSGPMPILIDLDGIRMLLRKLQGFGIERLLRAMRQHPQYTPEDSLALCRGFVPFGPIQQENAAGAGE